MDSKIIDDFIDGVGQPLSERGSIISTCTLCLGEEINGDSVETWLVDSNRTKLRKITKEEFDMILHFALTGM